MKVNLAYITVSIILICACCVCASEYTREVSYPLSVKISFAVTVAWILIGAMICRDPFDNP